MEERRILMLMTSYLVVTAIIFQRVAELFSELGLAPGWWPTAVLFYGAPTALWWAFHDRRVTFQMEGKRPLIALVVLALIVVSAVGIYSRFAIASDERVVVQAASFPFSGPIPWVFCASLGLVFFWRKPRPKATRIHFRGKRLQTSEEVDMRARASLKACGVGESPLVWGGKKLPRKAGRLHFVVIGVTGSGKPSHNDF